MSDVTGLQPVAIERRAGQQPMVIWARSRDDYLVHLALEDLDRLRVHVAVLPFQLEQRLGILRTPKRVESGLLRGVPKP